jgi:hypothetical protein
MNARRNSTENERRTPAALEAEGDRRAASDAQLRQLTDRRS